MGAFWSKEILISLFFIVGSLIGSYFILKINWKRYGLLYLISGAVGNTLCIVFIGLGFYTFPVTVIPNSPAPVIAVMTIFPYYVLLGVRYSPSHWAWKIPFYWVLVHIGVTLEAIAERKTDLIRYLDWDLWDTYTWWWIYFLLLEWVGGLIIPRDLRKPIDPSILRFGRWGWGIVHFILILTVFLGGVYVGRTMK